ncbi:hypothetical protein ACFWNT_15535 [Streptomyces sp. NPDC058409]|uniref:hypothetical protein n=1 Tax=Streptomyces sp. NPDC058409 TaxID=3346484 RepID=UPI00364D40AB
MVERAGPTRPGHPRAAALAETGGISPAQTLTLQTSPSVRGDLAFPARSRIAAVDVPVRMTPPNSDALFSAAVDASEADGAAVCHAGVARSAHVLIVAVFMTAAMAPRISSPSCTA